MNFQHAFLKIIFSSLILTINLAWGRFYIGVEGGYMRDNSIYIYEDNSGNTTTGKEENWRKNLIGNGIFTSLILGTELFFGENYFGLRWGVLGGYGVTQSKDSDWGNITLSTLTLGVNADVFANFYAKEDFMSGIFIGAEYDLTLLRPNKEISIGERATSTLPKEDMLVSNRTYSNNVALRVGFSTLVKSHHRLELLTKIPIYLEKHSQHFVMEGQQWNNAKDDRKYTFKYQYLQFLFGYKYVF